MRRDNFWVVGGLVALCGCSAGAYAAAPNPSGTELYATVTETMDSNLYRLPDNPGAFGISLPPGATRADRVTDLGAGIDADFHPGGQAISLRGSVVDVRFDRNSDLDYIGVNSRLGWDWVSGNDLAGELSAAYDRFLGGFVNNRVFVRDIIEHPSAAGNVRWAVGPTLALRLALDAGRISHSAPIEQYQDGHTYAGAVALEYVLSGSDNLRFNYRQARASYSSTALSYTDRTAFGSVSYALSGQTRLDADAGWYSRRYSTNSAADFSGGTAHAAVVWQATPLTSLTLKGWRELRAYLNNDSDYYVSVGGSAAVSWNAFETLSATLEGRWDHQDYKGSGLGVLAAVRRDNVSGGQLSVKWTPRQWLEFTLAGVIENRGSSNGYFSYDDRIVSGTLRLIW